MRILEPRIPAMRDRVSIRHWHLLLIIVVVLPLYVGNARWGTHGNADVVATALPAHWLANTGSLDLTDHPVMPENIDGLERWFVETEDGEIVSNRAPGLIALATPAYIVVSGKGFSLGPSTLVALLTTVLAIVVTWNVLIGLVGLTRATVAALTLALGTTTWAVSSAQLWPHGPGQLWAAFAISSLSVASFGRAGWAFAFSVTTRPLTGLFAGITGTLESIRNRSWRPLLDLGGIAFVGVVAVVIYNRLVFDAWSLRGGYSERFTIGALERFNVFDYLGNVFEMFLGLPNGLLSTTPIAAVSLLGVVLAWKRFPGWVRSAALAGAGYLLVHAALNRASGGSPAFYRYPLEALVLATPALALGGQYLWDSRTSWRRVVTIAIVASIALQFFHVFFLSCFITDPPVPACLLQ